MKNRNTHKNNLSAGDKITRKEALKKAGVTALTAASLLFLSARAGAQGSTISKQSKPTRPGPGR